MSLYPGWERDVYIRRCYPEHHWPVFATYDGERDWFITVIAPTVRTFGIADELFYSVYQRAPRKILSWVARNA